jgi:hypothetical protein
MSISSHCSLDALPTFGSGMGSRITRKLERVTTKGATTKAGVAASNPLVDTNTSLRMTSRSCTSSGSSSAGNRWLGTANSRYVHVHFYYHCLVLING